MQIFVYMPFSFCVFIPRIWVALQGLHGYEYRRRVAEQKTDGTERKGKREKAGEKERERRRRVEDRNGPAGGSPQATSDIPLSDGLMRLP